MDTTTPVGEISVSEAIEFVEKELRGLRACRADRIATRERLTRSAEELSRLEPAARIMFEAGEELYGPRIAFMDAEEKSLVATLQKLHALNATPQQRPS